MGLLLVVVLGVMDVLLRGRESVPASLWGLIDPSTERTPIERAMRRLPRR